MTPYERIAILQRLTHDRGLAEKTFPCSVYASCAGLRSPQKAKCPACPLR